MIKQKVKHWLALARNIELCFEWKDDKGKGKFAPFSSCLIGPEIAEFEKESINESLPVNTRKEGRVLEKIAKKAGCSHVTAHQYKKVKVAGQKVNPSKKLLGMFSKKEDEI